MPQNSSERVNSVSKSISVTVSNGAAISANIAYDGNISATVEQTNSATGVNDSTVVCKSSDWVLLSGYYTLNIPISSHLRGFNARVTGAESAEADAVVSYKRLPSGNILIYSSIPFDGRIFIR